LTSYTLCDFHIWRRVGIVPILSLQRRIELKQSIVLPLSTFARFYQTYIQMYRSLRALFNNFILLTHCAIFIYERELQLYQYWVHNEAWNASNPLFYQSQHLLDSIKLIAKCRGQLELYLIILVFLHIVLPLYMNESCICTDIEFTTTHRTHAIHFFATPDICLILSNLLPNIEVI
jgi:hypothetical protein